ncbi:MAG TPA: galactonate dehydratase [Gemmataceae bacterium]|nr:galactonate dehydratase [Gemmataceae bacterium]
MKIRDIETFLVNIGGQNRVLLRVLTDDHRHGTGEAYCVGPDEATVKTIHYFKDWLVGQDPMRIEYLWRLMYNGSRYPGGSVVTAAISGIEQALWDLKGKALGVPVYQLLGGRCRDKVRVYLGIGAVDDAKRAVDRGFTAVKTGPQPPGGDKMPWVKLLREAGRRMAELRKALGDEIDIALDPHAKIFESARAIELADVVSPYRPMFFEEAVRPENVQAMARVRQKTTVPIATGEELYTKYQFHDVMAAGAADILQPDLCIVGGLLEAKKIAAEAEAHCLTIAPHNPLGPVATAVCVHFAASTPNFVILEYHQPSPGPLRDMVLEPIKFKDGYLEIPDAPGLGIELDLKAIQKYPPKPWRRTPVFEADGNIGYI